ncbi:hypothetical protein RRG08_022066 [Elysia crispata]|uniref:Uncharacterized protein n=1 Tax=Elysia crispata TaxID=231223 RepID=A0AAE0Y250_9GAST|nr:hypothetical protein RRG08_022066 [Elysia crispata]
MQRLPFPKSPPGSSSSPSSSPVTSMMRRKPTIPTVGAVTCRTPTLKKMFVCSSGMSDFDEDDEVFETDSEDSCHFSPLLKRPMQRLGVKVELMRVLGASQYFGISIENRALSF